MSSHPLLIFVDVKKRAPLFKPPVLPRVGVTVGTGAFFGLLAFEKTWTHYLNELATWDHNESVLANRAKQLLSENYNWGTKVEPAPQPPENKESE